MENNNLRRQLSPMHVWAIAFGCVIGWGSFINPGKKFLPNSGVAGTAIAMVLGALVMIVIAFSYAYMVPKYPSAGGEFSFAKNCFGKRMAFLCGWFLVVAYLTNVPMNSTAIGLIVDGLDGTADCLKFGFHYSIAGFEIYAGEMLLSMLILVLFGWLNVIGVKKAGIVQTVLSSLLVTCVFVLCVSALFSSKAKGINMEPIWGFDKAAAVAAGAGTAEIGTYAHTGSAGIAGAILATFAIAPWAYVGFDAIPQAAEEFNFSFRKVSFIMIIAIVFGCFVYVSNNCRGRGAARRLRQGSDRPRGQLCGTVRHYGLLSGLLAADVLHEPGRLSSEVVLCGGREIRNAEKRYLLLHPHQSERADSRPGSAGLVRGYERHRRQYRVLFHLCQHPDHCKEKRRRDRLSEGHGMDRCGVQPDFYGSAADSHSGPVGRSLRQRKLYHAGHLDSDRPCVLF